MKPLCSAEVLAEHWSLSPKGFVKLLALRYSILICLWFSTSSRNFLPPGKRLRTKRLTTNYLLHPSNTTPLLRDFSYRPLARPQTTAPSAVRTTQTGWSPKTYPALARKAG